MAVVPWNDWLGLAANDKGIRMYNIEDGSVWAIVLGDGPEYEQQCGGYACRQEAARGVLVKLAGSDQEDALRSFFTGDKWCGWCDTGIDEETAAFIEKTVPAFAVDRGMLSDSCEAWVWGFVAERSSVLVWKNSD